MSDFNRFARAIEKQFNLMAQASLFITTPDNDQVWAQYLAAFPEGTNPVFRERTEHDCSCCRQFVKNIGNVVAIINGEKVSVWDAPDLEYPYNEVANHLAILVKDHPITSLFVATEPQYGNETTYERVLDATPRTWHHFQAKIPAAHYGKATAAQRKGEYNGNVTLLKRGLDELSPAAVSEVIDLILAKSLYRGEEHLPALQSFAQLQADYLRRAPHSQELMLWANGKSPGCRFRNTVIGTLVQDLTEGTGIEHAVRSFEAKVAPTNYKRTTALITPGMVKTAMATITELGLENALERRFARISDITMNNVVWADNSAQKQMKGSLQDLLLESAVVMQGKPAGKAQDITIADFLANVLPKAKGLEIFVRSNQQNQLMSLTAPVHSDVEPLFKWPNNFAWSYNGNIADSIKEKVKKAGGNVTNAKLRISLAWFNFDDLDIHVREPNGTHIYFGNKLGKLDVDMNAGSGRTREPVENVSFTQPTNGRYIVSVQNYRKRETTDVGFTIELEANGILSQYSYLHAMRDNEIVEVGTVLYQDGQIVSFTPNKEMTGGAISQEIWGMPTEQFVKVNTVMLSPNHWDDHSVGNKHYFFILEGCRNDLPTRGIYNEFLNSKLDAHRKVFEVLGDKTKCVPTDDQLSGLGFSSTRDDELTVMVSDGKTRKPYTIFF